MPVESYTKIRETSNGEIVRLDFSWTSKKGKVIDFAINVSLLEEEKHIDIYRIDTKHGYIHEHKFWKLQIQKLDMDYKKAFNEKKNEVMENYERWIMLFKKYR